MSKWMIIASGVMYLYVAIEQYIKGNAPMALAYAGYAFSNIGLYYAVE